MQKRFDLSVNKQIISTLLFTAIGTAFAKRLGAEIVLHTDNFGAKLFDCLPYSQVYLTLEGHDINRQFWASGKMLALAKEPSGSCHLDLDAWIKFSECRDILLNSNADLIIQSIEDSADVYSGIKDVVFNNIDNPDFIDLKKCCNFKAYNCGLVKINNPQLKELYLHAYWKITNQLNAKKFSEIEEKYCIPDLISEQWLLYQLCEQNNFSVEYICDGWADQARANKIGYTHLISEQKYYIDEELNDVLLQLDADLLKKVTDKTEKITEMFNE